MNKNLIKKVYDLAEEANDRMKDCYDLCYKDGTPSAYDALHDSIFFQLDGIDLSLEEFKNVKDTLEPQHFDAYIAEFTEVIELTKQIERFFEAAKKVEELQDDIFWMYA